MDATPINFDTAVPLGSSPTSDSGAADATARTWTALHEAAFVVATLAGTAQSALAADLRDFPAAVARAPRWRRELAKQGVEDLVAIMEPGLAALIAVHGRGGDAGAPARALWHEFTAARDAVLGLVLPRD